MSKGKELLRGTRESLLQILFPERCLCCGEDLLFQGSGGRPVCALCRRTLQPISAAQRCRCCSIPLAGQRLLCCRCRGRSFAFVANHSIYEYRGPVRQLISQFKFSHRRRVAGLFAELMAPVLRDRFPGLPVVPVPGSARSVRKRGWDPLLEVGRSLLRIGPVSVLPLLVRRGGGPQKGLDYRRRLTNVRGRIALRPGAGRLPPQAVLIDDIFTTGATADECARVLCEAGVGRLQVLTLAMEY